VGGDGTINEIANGFYENQKLINPDASLGIVPSGTGCDFIKSLNIPSGINGALKAIAQAPSALVDVGRARYRNHSGQEEERCFMNVADFGLGGEVIEKVNENRKKRKASSYLRCLASTVTKYKCKKLKLSVDGTEIPQEEYFIGAVANGKIFGKGMKIAPSAKLDDGFFDLVLVKSMKLLEFGMNAWKIFLGTHLSHSKISLIHARKIEVTLESDETDVLLELDGEQLGKLPAVFEIVPQSFPLKGYP
jgi:YegS/Rv2252/BmrU family lipid kinase